jgi:hypothetical protein
MSAHLSSLNQILNPSKEIFKYPLFPYKDYSKQKLNNRVFWTQNLLVFRSRGEKKIFFLHVKRAAYTITYRFSKSFALHKINPKPQGNPNISDESDLVRPSRFRQSLSRLYQLFALPLYFEINR